MITVQASVIGIARAATRAATPTDALEQMPNASDKNAVSLPLFPGRILEQLHEFSNVEFRNFSVLAVESREWPV
jgi:hypothetical protein